MSEPTDDVRLADGSVAPPQAFVVHGLALTLMGLVARLATAGQLEALRVLDYASYVQQRSVGTSRRPTFEMIIEADDDAWATLQVHVGEIVTHLEAISGPIWTVRRSLPLSIKDLKQEPVELTRKGVSAALAGDGSNEEAVLALRATGFQIRPRPDGGTQIVTVHDREMLADDERTRIDSAIFRAIPRRTRPAIVGSCVRNDRATGRTLAVVAISAERHAGRNTQLEMLAAPDGAEWTPAPV